MAIIYNFPRENANDGWAISRCNTHNISGEPMRFAAAVLAACSRPKANYRSALHAVLPCSQRDEEARVNLQAARHVENIACVFPRQNIQQTDAVGDIQLRMQPAR